MVLLTSKCNPQLTLPFWLNSCFHCHHYEYHCRCFTVSKKHILGLQNHRQNDGAVLCGKNAASTKDWFDTLLHGCTGDAAVKNLSANAGDIGDVDLIPESGRYPGGGNDNLLQDSCLKNSMDRGAWWTIVHVKSQTWLHTHCICSMGLHSMTPKRNSSWFGFAAPFSLAFRKKPMKSDTKRLWRRIWAAFSAFTPSSV